MENPLLPIFSSLTRLKLLGYFSKNLDQKLHFQEILRLLDLEARNTFLEIHKLETLGFLKSEKKGRLKYFWTNPESPYLAGFQALFKTTEDSPILNPCLKLVVSSLDGHLQLLAPASHLDGINGLFEQYKIKTKLSLVLHHYQNKSYNVWLKQDELEQLSTEISTKFLAEPEYFEKYRQDFELNKNALFEVIKELKTIELSKLTNLELSKIYQEIYQKYTNFSLLQWLVMPFEAYNVNYQTLEPKIIDLILSKTNLSSRKAQEYFYRHVTVSHNLQEQLELQDFLTMLNLVKNNKELKTYLASNDTSILKSGLKINYPNFYNQIKDQADKFHAQAFRYIGKGWDFEYYLELVRNYAIHFDLLKKDVLNPLVRVNLQVKNEIGDILNQVQMLNTLLSTRRFVFYKFLAETEKLYLEIAKRLGLNINQVRYLYSGEIQNFLNQGLGKSLTSIKKMCFQRKMFGLDISDWKQNQCFLTHKLAQNYLNQFEMTGESEFHQKVFRGEILFGGQVFGKISKQIKPKSIILINNTNNNFEQLFQADILGIILVGQTKHTFLYTNIARIKKIPCISISESNFSLDFSKNYFLDGSHGKLKQID